MRRVVVATLVLVALVACGDDGSDEAVSPAQFTTDCPESVDYSAPTLEVKTAEPPRMGRPVAWQLILTNGGPDTIVMQFGSSQLGDVVLEQDGEEIYRWSRERMFTQSIQCLELRGGESARLDLTDDTLEINAGKYDLTATVASQPNAPRPVRRTVTVLPR